MVAVTCERLRAVTGLIPAPFKELMCRLRAAHANTMAGAISQQGQSTIGLKARQPAQLVGRAARTRTEPFDPRILRLSEAFSNPHRFGAPSTR